MELDLAYTHNGPVYIPEQRFSDLEGPGDPRYAYAPLRGSSSTMAVFDRAKGNCVGWVLVSAKVGIVAQWMSRADWVNEGY